VAVAFAQFAHWFCHGVHPSGTVSGGYVWAGAIQPFDRVSPWRDDYAEVVSVHLELVGVAPAEAVKKLHDVECRLPLGRCRRFDSSLGQGRGNSFEADAVGAPDEYGTSLVISAGLSGPSGFRVR